MKRNNVLIAVFAILTASSAARAEDSYNKTLKAVSPVQADAIKVAFDGKKSGTADTKTDIAALLKAGSPEVCSVKYTNETCAKDAAVQPSAGKRMTLPQKREKLTKMSKEEKQAFLNQIWNTGQSRKAYSFGDCWDGEESIVDEYICRTVCCLASGDNMHSPADENGEVTCFDDCKDGTADGKPGKKSVNRSQTK